MSKTESLVVDAWPFKSARPVNVETSVTARVLLKEEAPVTVSVPCVEIFPAEVVVALPLTLKWPVTRCWPVVVALPMTLKLPAESMVVVAVPPA